tara:strand:- start:29867 stop:30331 length:465 start_codon:yes stop_codon:yes gene_type:complete
MKAIKIALALLFVVLIVVAILAPIGPLPGLRIGGNESPVPANWGDTSQIHEIKLKVPGTIPRVVIIWVIQYEGDLYVVGNSSSGWVKMLGKGGPVSVRIDDNTYHLNASQLMTGWEPVMQSYMDKYRPDYPEIVNNFPDAQDAIGTISVFRLGT